MIDRLSEKIKNLPYLHSFFFVGSTLKKRMNSYSDLDIVFICREESLLDRFLIAIQDWLDQDFGLLFFNKPSAYHIYCQLLNGTIIDANIFPPSILSFTDTKIERILPNSEKLFQGAIIWSKRLYSKLINKEFILIPRFIEQMRNLYLFPLLGLHQFPQEINQLKEPFKSLLLETYTTPVYEPSRRAIFACLELQKQLLANWHKSCWYENINNQIEELLNESFAQS